MINYSGPQKKTKLCPICNGDQHTKTDYLPGKDYFFRICKFCDHGWRFPPDKNEIEIIYKEPPINLINRPRWGFVPWMIGRNYRKYAPRMGNILEVGCNNGHFLYSFGKKWSKYGVDINSSAIEVARKHIKGLFFNGFVEDIIPELSKTIYDIIIVHAVIEHLVHPSQTIEQLAELLSEEGILCIMTPDRATLSAESDGLMWSLLHSVGHLHYFSHRSLESMLLKIGLIPIDRKWRGERQPAKYAQRKRRGKFVRRIYTALHEFSPILEYPCAPHLYVVTKKIHK